MILLECTIILAGLIVATYLKRALDSPMLPARTAGVRRAHSSNQYNSYLSEDANDTL